MVSARRVRMSRRHGLERSYGFGAGRCLAVRSHFHFWVSNESDATLMAAVRWPGVHLAITSSAQSEFSAWRLGRLLGRSIADQLLANSMSGGIDVFQVGNLALATVDPLSDAISRNV